MKMKYKRSMIQLLLNSSKAHRPSEKTENTKGHNLLV